MTPARCIIIGDMGGRLTAGATGSGSATSVCLIGGALVVLRVRSNRVQPELRVIVTTAVDTAATAATCCLGSATTAASAAAAAILTTTLHGKEMPPPKAPTQIYATAPPRLPLCSMLLTSLMSLCHHTMPLLM